VISDWSRLLASIVCSTPASALKRPSNMFLRCILNQVIDVLALSGFILDRAASHIARIVEVRLVELVLIGACVLIKFLFKSVADYSIVI